MFKKNWFMILAVRILWMYLGSLKSIQRAEDALGCVEQLLHLSRALQTLRVHP